MKKNSALSLSETLQKKEQADSIQQMQHERQQQQLVRGLSDIVSTELATMQNAIRSQMLSLERHQKEMMQEMRNQQSQFLQVMEQSKQSAIISLRWSWLKVTVPIIIVLVIILSASWGLIHWSTNQALNIRTEIQRSKQVMESLPKDLKFISNTDGDHILMKKEPEIYKSTSGDWVMKLNK